MKALFGYLRYLRPFWGRLLAAIACGLVYGAASGFGVPYFFGRVYGDVFEREIPYTTAELLLVTLMLPLIFLLRGITGYANQYLLNEAGQRVIRELRADLFTHLQKLPLRFFETRTSGDLLSRLTADSLVLQRAVIELADNLVRQPVQMIGALTFLGWLSVTNKESAFLLLFLAVLPATAIPVRVIGKHLKRRGRESQETLGEVTQTMNENLDALVEVRSFNLEGREQARFRDRLGRYFTAQMKLIKYEKVTQPIMELVGAGVVAASFFYAYRQGIPASVFLSLGAALYFCFDPLKRLIRLQNEVQKATGAIERLEAILKESPSIAEPERPVKVTAITGAVSFQDVDFSYDEGELPALRNINIQVEPGEVIALVGPSGAGKSTFAKLLPRFYDTTAGMVSVDGYDVRMVPLARLREAIALVPQKPVLFNATVRENLLLGRPGASEKEVEAAAQAAFADDFIRALPDGYETVVGEDAVRLSGGQRQRLALARAFLKNAPILILDEATSALDSESERRIQEALTALVKGKTVFLIAHRLSTVTIADRILVFEEGKLAATGKHENLYADNAFYRTICDQQLRSKHVS